MAGVTRHFKEGPISPLFHTGDIPEVDFDRIAAVTVVDGIAHIPMSVRYPGVRRPHFRATVLLPTVLSENAFQTKLLSMRDDSGAHQDFMNHLSEISGRDNG
ncbi:hypothetical protein ACFL2C_02720 [Patescibacteria group bacterium]